ncbi:MAG: flagellar hook protein FlgE [Tepidisphaeraceae bacterium]
MALTSTLFTGLSGLDVNQTRLNVVGNNIANVNTVAFKSSRAIFKPQFYVTDSAGTPSSTSFGGTNPSQRGLGAVVATIEKDFSPGSIEPTGKTTDLAVDGDGFFVVQGAEQKFTRDGSFNLNSSNELVTSAGDFVQGFGVDENGNVLPGTLQNIQVPLGTLTTAKATENVTLVGNLNADGEIPSGASVWNTQALEQISDGLPASGATALTNLTDAGGATMFSLNDVITIAGTRGGRDLPDASFVVGTDVTDVNSLLTRINEAMGIDTTITPTPTPAPGATITAGGLIMITGNTGTENALSFTGAAFTVDNGTAPFTFTEDPTSNPTGESVHTSFVGYDSLGTPLVVDLTVVLESKADTGNTWRFYAQSGDDTDTDLVLGTGTLTFDNEGKLTATTGDTITIDRTDTGATTPLNIAMDFSTMTSLTSRDSELVMKQQDGSPIGTLNAFSIGADGTITGSFTNGLTQTLGQVAMATFANPLGLTDIGGNMYSTGANSGVPVVSSPLTLGAGSIRAGALELSNVDLSEEFINMIISSTGFSASSRVITTSDQLITELLNSTR